MAKFKEMMKNPFYPRHPDDKFWDEIRLDVADHPLRAVTRYRYKMSGLSGDEWRTSVFWQEIEDDSWVDFDGAYSDLKTACSALYPGIYTSHPDLHDLECRATEFYRKGRKLYEMTYDGAPLHLLAVAGHLTWALIAGMDNGFPIPKDDKEFCFQAGCPEKAISEYELKFEYCRQGHKNEPLGPVRRRFCGRHLRRGDCGLEDADENYIVISGPGPDGGERNVEDESESVFGGVIDFS